MEVNLVDNAGPSISGSMEGSTVVSVSTPSHSSESMPLGIMLGENEVGKAVPETEIGSVRGMPNSVPARSTASAPHIGISAATPATLLPVSGRDVVNTDPSAPRLGLRDVSCAEGGSARALVWPPVGDSSPGVPTVKSLGCLQKTGNFAPVRTPMKGGSMPSISSASGRVSVARRETQRGDTNRSVSPPIPHNGKSRLMSPGRARGMSPGRGGSDLHTVKDQSKELNALKDQIESLMAQNLQLKKQVEESNRTRMQLKNSLNEERINVDAERIKLKALNERMVQLEATQEASAAYVEENRSLHSELNAQKEDLQETRKMLASSRESALGGSGLQNMSIIVPEGAVEGAVVQAHVPNGGVVQVTVPAGVLPGETISVQAEDLGERLWEENAQLWHELQQCRVILANYIDKFMAVMPGMEAMVTEWKRNQGALPRGNREEQHVRFPFEPGATIDREPPVLEMPKNIKTLSNLDGDKVAEESPKRNQVVIPSLGLSQVNSLGRLRSLTNLETSSLPGSTRSGGTNSGRRRFPEPRVSANLSIPTANDRQELGGPRPASSPAVGVGPVRRASRPASPLCSGGKSPAPAKSAPQQSQIVRPRSQDKRVGRPIASRERR